MTRSARDGSGRTPRPVDTEGMDPAEVAAVKQLSREVLILEMLKTELLERNARLERWHAEHPRISSSQSGSSQAPQDSDRTADASAPESSAGASIVPTPEAAAAEPCAPGRGRGRSGGERRGGSVLPR